VGQREFFLEPRNTCERALNLVAGQTAKDPMNLFDLGNAMADHGQIISRFDCEPNCFFETVLIQDRAHIQVIGHDQTVEAKFCTE
jgi:hypothetical protein